MKCPVCGIEMTRKDENTWVCRNPRCTQHPKKEEK